MDSPSISDCLDYEVFDTVSSMKTCIHCELSKENKDFKIDRRNRDGLSATCKDCSNARRRKIRIDNGGSSAYEIEYRKTHRVELREKFSAKYKDLRRLFFSMYGNKCECCGEEYVEFLTIEHKQGQKGLKRRGAYSSYKDATSVYRPDLYETLCMNCNHSKGRYGYCLHKVPISM